MDYILQPATPENLQIVLTWVDTPELLRFWGGPILTFPPLVSRTWLEIGATGQNTYSLMDAEGNVAGFGQTLFHAPVTVHLGRIIISPAERGKGLGRILCQRLIEVGSERYQPSEFTLNVYQDNALAFNLYTGLGFRVWLVDQEHHSYRMGLQVNPAGNKS